MLLGALVTVGCGHPIYADPGASDTDAATPGTAPGGNSGLRLLSVGYVLDRLQFPVGIKNESRFDVEISSKARRNQFRDMLRTISQWGLASDLQQHQDHAVCSGAALTLLQFKANNIINYRKVWARAWIGRQTSCCALPVCTDPRDPATCGDLARSRCFSGTNTLWPQGNSQSLLIPGNTNYLQLSLGPQTIPLAISLPGAGTIQLKLRVATLLGTLEKNRIVNGVLGGGVHVTEVVNTLCPAVARMIHHGFRQTNSPIARKFALMMLDTNMDDHITSEEIACNTTLLLTLVRPDWDQNGDGREELFSVGLGFSAVSANIPVIF